MSDTTRQEAPEHLHILTDSAISPAQELASKQVIPPEIEKRQEQLTTLLSQATAEEIEAAARATAERELVKDESKYLALYLLTQTLPRNKASAAATTVILGSGIGSSVVLYGAGASAGLAALPVAVAVPLTAVGNALLNDHQACLEAGRRAGSFFGKLLSPRSWFGKKNKKK